MSKPAIPHMNGRPLVLLPDGCEWDGWQHLRDLHQEIDLYDRKLAYLDQFAEFASPADREVAEKGLRAKRAPLEKTALELVASGVEYEEKDLPRSFRTMNLEHEGAQRNLNLVKRTKRLATAQTVADR